jgi:2-iminobutanoate/2-iminopropanoate deaminase
MYSIRPISHADTALRDQTLPFPFHELRAPAFIIQAEWKLWQFSVSPRAESIKGGPMTRQIVFSTKAAKPPATYSQAVKAAGLIFVSGTAPHDPATGAIKGVTIQEQTRQCLANISAILEEAGSSLDKIVSVTIVLADEDDFQGMNEEWVKWFPSEPPARQGAKLPARIPGLKVSIAAIAEA